MRPSLLPSPPLPTGVHDEALHHIKPARVEGAASTLLLLIATRLDLRRDLRLHAATRGVVRGVRDGARGAVDQFRQAEQLSTESQPSARKTAPAEREREKKKKKKREVGVGKCGRGHA